MDIHLIQSPYFLGRTEGMGLAPSFLCKAGIIGHIEKFEHSVQNTVVQMTSPFENKLDAMADIYSKVAMSVKSSIEYNQFPIILGGPCSVALGVLQGLNTPRTGVIWFDAHGDFNTPQITISNFFDGMPLAIATGRCYKKFYAQIGNRGFVLDENIIHIGARALDQAEELAFQNSKIAMVNNKHIKKHDVITALEPAIKKLSKRLSEVYIHFDIDVLDPAIAPGVNFRSPNGLSLNETADAIEVIAAYNPKFDENKKTIQSVFYILTNVLNQVSKQRLMLYNITLHKKHRQLHAATGSYKPRPF